MGSPFNGLSDVERDVIEGIVDDLYGQFTGVVVSRREMNGTDIAFDGRVFTGRDAMRIGLVDTLCDLDASINRARELSGADGNSGHVQAALRLPREHLRDLTRRGRGSAGGPTTIHVPGLADLTRMLSPGAYYLWMP